MTLTTTALPDLDPALAVRFVPPRQRSGPELMVLGWQGDVDLFAIGLRGPDGVEILTSPTRDGMAMIRLVGPTAGSA